MSVVKEEKFQWQNLPTTKTYYYIEKVEKIQTSKGEATLMTLQDLFEGVNIKVYATSLLAKELEVNGINTGYFIESTDPKNSTQNNGYKLIKEPSLDELKYEDYDTIY